MFDVSAIFHYENFPVASILLPGALRAPIAHIYRFARSADDIADEGDSPDEARLRGLDAYRAELDRIARGERSQNELFVALATTIAAYRLPIELFRDLLNAFTQDVLKKRYADIAELIDYSRRSANPVGRLLLHLFGMATPENLRLSDAICSGLQLANFWQDVAIDFEKGRIYIPGDEMRSFGVDERQIAEQRCDAAWRLLMLHQIRRTRSMLEFGAPLGRRLPGRIGLEIRTTVAGGLRILEKLESAGFDMFRARPVLRWYDWPLLLLRSLR